MENKKRFVIEYVDLMQNWDWDKNNELGLFPDKITFGCNKKVWWKCTKCGHSWLASPNNRTNGQTGCPCCAGRVVVRGKNDLQTKFPEIAKRWHPTKNSKKPWEVTAFSNQKAWFVCEKDERHIFEARINHITHGEIICPVCANQQIIVGLNDFQTTNLELMYEWNWEKNNNIGIFPTQITRGYNKRV